MLTVAILGRPNVGKSTLFNRLVGQRLALVHDQPGVTRDRREGLGRLGPLRFRLMDTAGYEDAEEAESLSGRMQAQTAQAVEDADLCLLVIDARQGIVPLDEIFAERLRRIGKPVVLVANKHEGGSGEAGYLEAFGLGFGEPVAVSAEHGLGLEDLYSTVAPLFETLEAQWEARGKELGESHAEGDGEGPPAAIEGSPDKALRLAIIGRPNVGKSTLINSLIGEDRMLTGPEAGLTRDSIAVDWHQGERPVRLFDTAGLRKKGKVVDDLEKLSVGETLRAIRFAEVVVLVFDATQAFEKQDLQLADLVVREGRALVIGFNKWDLIENKPAAFRAMREKAERLLPQIRGVPLVTFSALYGQGLERMMPAVEEIFARWNRRVPTRQLNDWLAGVQERHPPPAVQGRRIRLRYVTQAKARPPSFALFSSRADRLPESYRRYLINDLREVFDLPGVPIRLMLRKPDNPYAAAKSR